MENSVSVISGLRQQTPAPDPVPERRERKKDAQRRDLEEEKFESEKKTNGTDGSCLLACTQQPSFCSLSSLCSRLRARSPFRRGLRNFAQNDRNRKAGGQGGWISCLICIEFNLLFFPSCAQFFLHKTFGHFLKQKLVTAQLELDLSQGIFHLKDLELNNVVSCIFSFYLLIKVSSTRFVRFLGSFYFLIFFFLFSRHNRKDDKQFAWGSALFAQEWQDQARVGHDPHEKYTAQPR